MGKEHVTAHLDKLLAIDADSIGVKAAAEAAAELAKAPGDFKLAQVLADDLMGGWTNRYANEYTQRFPHIPNAAASGSIPKWLKHFWLTALVWTSDAPTPQAVREAVRTALFRVAYFQQHGLSRTLQETNKTLPRKETKLHAN